MTATARTHLDADVGAVVIPVRWTVAMTEKEGTWRRLHRHASAAASSQRAGAAYPCGDGPER